MRRRRILLIFIAVILLGGALAMAHFLHARGGAVSLARPARASTPALPAAMPLPDGVAWAEIVISADGRHLAFAARDADGATRVLRDGEIFAAHPAT
ncbi:MAG TPA: hypothetical protein PLZ36_00640 [Armatimonadota bacterium]|nr:hypothetical protein [Armatimonadota bacterium]